MKLFQAVAAMFTLSLASLAIAGGALIGGSSIPYPEYPTKHLVREMSEFVDACLVNTSHLVKNQEDGEVLVVMCTSEALYEKGWDLSATISIIAQSMVDQSEYAILARKSGLMELMSHSIDVIFNRPGARERLIRTGDISPTLVNEIGGMKRGW